jgi:transposase
MDMSDKEWTRKHTLERHRVGKLSTVEAAQILKVSSRQVRRLAARYEPGKLVGIRHGLRGQEPSNKTPSELWKRVEALFTCEFAGFNDTHFVESLKEHHQLTIGRSTVQRLARASGLKAARKRRSRRYRSRREREGQRGKMLLWDGSYDDWLEGRAPKMCLMGAVDDATGELLPGAHFLPQESAAGYLRVLSGIASECGIPGSIYMDRHGSLRRNDGYWTIEEELQGEQTPTHVGQALRELGIESIFALSPQAKGRVERLWGTLQDRLKSEMRRAGISTLEDANTFLQAYRPKFNRRFQKLARDTTNAFRPLPPRMRIEEVCAFRYEAVVSNDNLISIDGIKLQIPRPSDGRSFAKASVQVRQLLNGSWRIFYKQVLLAELQVQGTANEVHPRRTHRRSASTKAFLKAVRTFKAPRSTSKKPPQKSPAPKPLIRPFNYWSPKEKKRAAKKSKLLREQRPASW